jgi:glutamate synthase (NADPH/NADH) large chain
MAELGFRKINDMVGRVDLLEMRDVSSHWKYKNLDLSPILSYGNQDSSVPVYKSEEQDHGMADQLDWKLLDLAKDSLVNQKETYAELPIINANSGMGSYTQKMADGTLSIFSGPLYIPWFFYYLERN